MNYWYPLDQDVPDHPKVHRLARALGVGRHEALGLLVNLWCQVCRVAPDGDLRDFSEEGLEDLVRWRGQEGALVEALVSCRLLDVVTDVDAERAQERDQKRDQSVTHFVVHDWAGRMAKSLRSQEKARKRKARHRDKQSSERDQKRDQKRDSQRHQTVSCHQGHRHRHRQEENTPPLKYPPPSPAQPDLPGGPPPHPGSPASQPSASFLGVDVPASLTSSLAHEKGSRIDDRVPSGTCPPDTIRGNSRGSQMPQTRWGDQEQVSPGTGRSDTGAQGEMSLANASSAAPRSRWGKGPPIKKTPRARWFVERMQSLELVEGVEQVLAEHSRRHPRAKPSELHRGLIAERLAPEPLGDGYTVEQLLEAMEGIHRSSWHVDNGRAGDLELVYRDGEHVERYRQLAQQPADRPQRDRAQVDAASAWEDLYRDVCRRGASNVEIRDPRVLAAVRALGGTGEIGRAHEGHLVRLRATFCEAYARAAE